jgi:hypothetical protein
MVCVSLSSLMFVHNVSDLPSTMMQVKTAPVLKFQRVGALTPSSLIKPSNPQGVSLAPTLFEGTLCDNNTMLNINHIVPAKTQPLNTKTETGLDYYVEISKLVQLLDKLNL